jgi:hypothetical protein
MWRSQLLPSLGCDSWSYGMASGSQFPFLNVSVVGGSCWLLRSSRSEMLSVLSDALLGVELSWLWSVEFLAGTMTICFGGFFVISLSTLCSL